MGYKTILVHLGDDPPSAARLGLAVALAQGFEAHLVGIAVVPPPLLPPSYGEAVTFVGPELIEAQRAAAREVATRLRAGFESAAGRAGLGHEWRQEEGDAQRVLTWQARYADLAVIGQSEAEGIDSLAEQTAERVMLGSGGPVLVVPYAGSFQGFGRHLMVAWNGSRESSRAVRDSLPLLKRADRVTVLEVGPKDERGQATIDLATMLARHGVKVTAEHTVSGGMPIGELLLSHLADRGCDGLVMGAYGHSRLRELVLGGVTRSLIDHMTVPVLFAC
jgi:nucleotide-binding universal stress UspA family protein